MAAPLIRSFGLHLAHVGLHPVLVLFGVHGVLVNTPQLHLPGLVLVLDAVAIESHLHLLVLEWIERLRRPLHVPVLGDELYPLGGCVGSCCAHAVVSSVTVPHGEALHPP